MRGGTAPVTACTVRPARTRWYLWRRCSNGEVAYRKVCHSGGAVLSVIALVRGMLSCHTMWCFVLPYNVVFCHTMKKTVQIKGVMSPGRVWSHHCRCCCRVWIQRFLPDRIQDSVSNMVVLCEQCGGQISLVGRQPTCTHVLHRSTGLGNIHTYIHSKHKIRKHPSPFFRHTAVQDLRTVDLRTATISQESGSGLGGIWFMLVSHRLQELA